MIRKSILILSLSLAAFSMSLPCYAKKYKWKNNSHVIEVYTTGQGKNRSQLIKAWAVAKSADKAIAQAKMDAIEAALFKGIGWDEKNHGMGVSNLRPLVSEEVYKENEKAFKDFFESGTFLQYVREINSQYPSGENNVKCPGGRRVGVNLVVDYPGLNHWLEEKGLKKGLGDYFKN